MRDMGQVDISIIFAGLSIAASIVYYASVIRNANRTRELQLHAQEQAVETRQAQLLMQVYNRWSDFDQLKRENLIRSWEWEDYDDFISKYGYEADPDAFAAFGSIGGFYEGLGVLVKRKLIDVELVEDLLSGYIIWHWETFGSLYLEYRERLNSPTIMEYAEYLYNKIKPIYDEQHPELAT